MSNSSKDKKIIYQLALRTFTPKGTLRAATERLAHVASLGVDIVYICPFFVTENDENREILESAPDRIQYQQPEKPV
jgi:glycosidase